MADFLTSNILLGLSVARQTLGTPKVLAADYVAAMTTALSLGLPVPEKVLDEKLIGVGNEYPKVSSNDYITPPTISLSDRLNTDQFAVLAARHLGGTIVNSTVATGVYDHVIPFTLTSADPTPVLSSVAGVFGGLDLILADMIVNSLSFSFTDSNRPTYQAELTGTGKFDYMGTQTIPLVLPAAVAQNYTGSNAAIVVTLDDGSAMDLSALGRLQSFSIQSALNADVQDRRPGDSFRTAGDINSGAVVGRASRGDRTTQVSLGVYNDANRREFLMALNNTTIDSLKFKALGNKIGVTAFSHEVEVTIPSSVVRVVGFGDNRGKQILPLTFEPLLKSGEVGIFKMRIRNATATLV